MGGDEGESSVIAGIVVGLDAGNEDGEVFLLVNVVMFVYLSVSIDMPKCLTPNSRCGTARRAGRWR